MRINLNELPKIGKLEIFTMNKNFIFVCGIVALLNLECFLKAHDAEKTPSKKKEINKGSVGLDSLGDFGLLGGSVAGDRLNESDHTKSKVAFPKVYVKEMEDKSNAIYTFKSNLFLWYLGLSVEQLSEVAKIQGTSFKTNIPICLKWTVVSETKNEDVKSFKNLEEYILLLKKAENGFKKDFSRSYRGKLADTKNWDEMYDIIDRLDVIDNRSNVTYEIKYDITSRAREQSKVFFELLDISQIISLMNQVNVGYDSPKNQFLDLMNSPYEGVEWKVEREKTIENTLAQLGLDFKSEQVLKTQLNHLLDEVEALRKKNGKKNFQISSKKEKQFVERFLSLTKSSLKKMAIIQNILERKLAYELSNPEFENVIKMHLDLSKSSFSKFVSQDLSELTKGIKIISSPGTAGRVTVFGEKAFAVVVGKVNDNSVQAAVAAGTLGKGRVVAFSHAAYLSNLECLKEGDSSGFLKNAILWAASGKQSPKIVILGDESLIKVLELVGFKAEKANLQKLTTDQVLISQEDFVQDKDVETISKFIMAGGGFVTASTGWGWKQLHPGKDLKIDYAANKILNQAGLAFADGYLEDTTDEYSLLNGFVVTPHVPLMTNVTQALKTAMAVSKGMISFSSLDDVELAAVTLAEALSNLDPSKNPIIESICAFVKSMPSKFFENYPQMGELKALLGE